MPVTLAVSTQSPQRRPPPLPMPRKLAAASLPPPTLPSMRVLKGSVRHEDSLEDSEWDLRAADIKARLQTEEREWQAQMAKVRAGLLESEAAEWSALKARVQAEARVVDLPARAVARQVIEARQRIAASEEREWQILLARTRRSEEHEWQDRIARAQSSLGQPTRQRPTQPRGHVVAWP